MPALLVALALLRVEPVSASQHPFLYWGQAITGWVVDAETRRPVEGVVVVAQWVHTGGYRLHVAEVLTEHDGRYHVPAWGPKPRHVLAPRLSGYNDPQILMFKPGYARLELSNRFLDNYDAVRTSDWDGQTVELTRFQGTTEDQARDLTFLQASLDWGGPHGNWRDFPRMILAVAGEAGRLPRTVAWRPREISAFAGLTEETLRRYVTERGR